MIRTAVLAAIGTLGLTACLRAGDDRPARDLDIGRATTAGATVDVAGGLAHVRAFTVDPDGTAAVELWAQAPVLDLTVDVVTAGTWTFTLDNAISDVVLTGDDARGPLAPTELMPPAATIRAFTVWLVPGRATLHLAPLDAADVTTPWRFAVLGDIQTALPTVDDVFTRISTEPGLRFVISTGDVVDRGQEEEYALFDQQLTTLTLPFYSTIGNHELWGDIERWYGRFGRTTVHFDFRGVAFSLVDSASAGIDPDNLALLDGWLDDHAAGIHVFATHYPPLDPVGVRQGSFASRREAQSLLARLAAASVDLTLYGHLHTYTRFSNAGIPAHVSGGGGADPMRFDGIDRHFLVVDVDPAANLITSVRVVRVDDSP